MKTQDDASGLSLSVESFLALGQISLNQGSLGQAFIMFEAAARSGDVRAVNMLGRAFAMGWGTARNPVMAAQCFQEAARAGYGWAMFNLADLYMQQSALETCSNQHLNETSIGRPNFIFLRPVLV